MKHSKHEDPELQLMQSSSTSHTDESMVSRMTQVLKHDRFLYSTIVDWCNQTLTGQRPYIEESLGGVRSQSLWSRPHSYGICHQGAMHVATQFWLKVMLSCYTEENVQTQSHRANWKEECFAMFFVLEEQAHCMFRNIEYSHRNWNLLHLKAGVIYKFSLFSHLLVERCFLISSKIMSKRSLHLLYDLSPSCQVTVKSPKGPRRPTSASLHKTPATPHSLRVFSSPLSLSFSPWCLEAIIFLHIPPATMKSSTRA